MSLGVTDSNELTFRAPHPGHFLGDITAEPDFITEVAKLNDEDVPNAPSSQRFLGDLHKFPPEILLRILSLLDLCTLVDFRRINQHSLRFADSLPGLQTIKSFPRLLDAILKLQCRSYDLATLVACVNDPQCSNCKHYGDHLYLLTAERLCYFCFRESPIHVPVAVESEKSLTDLPTAIVPSGRYGMHGRGQVQQPQLVADRRAARLGRVQADKQGDDPEANRQEFMRHHGFSCRFTQEYFPLYERYTVVIRAPYVDKSTKSLENGFLCRACALSGTIQHRGVWDKRRMFWGYPFRRYTKDGFKQHQEEFGEVLKDGAGKYVHATAARVQYKLPTEYIYVATNFAAYRDGKPLPRLLGPGVPTMERTITAEDVSVPILSR